MQARLGVVLLASVAAAGCLSSSTIVKVRADGSGTVEVTAMLRNAALIELFAFADGGKPGRQQPRVEDWLPDSDTHASTSRIGDDVRLHTTLTIQNEHAIGRTNTYEFSDVRALALEALPLLPGSYGVAEGLAVHGEHRFTFDLVEQADGHRLLIVRLPEARFEYSGVETLGRRMERADPAEDALLRSALAGANLEIAIETELPIVRVNTLHREGQRVTLLAIDAERLMLSEETPSRLLLRPGSLDELRLRLHDLPGVTVALDREIRIELASKH